MVTPFSFVLTLSAAALGMGLLLLTLWLERSFLSPRYLITRTVKVRNSPEHAERMIAVHAEQLLRALED